MKPDRALLVTALAASLGLAACAGTPPPIGQLGAAEQAIAGAEQAGALQHAPVELQRARDKLAAADDAVRNEENDAARRLAEEARADAELAAARAQSATAAEAAGAVIGSPGYGSPGYGSSGDVPVGSGSSVPESPYPTGTLGTLRLTPPPSASVPPVYQRQSTTRSTTQWSTGTVREGTIP